MHVHSHTRSRLPVDRKEFHLFKHKEHPSTSTSTLVKYSEYILGVHIRPMVPMYLYQNIHFHEANP